LKGGAQQEAIRQLTGEIDNIRTAWVWAIEHKKFGPLEQAGRGFGWYFEITGLYREGIEQLELLVQALKPEPQEYGQRRLLGLTLLHQALLHFRKGEFGQARSLYEECIHLLRPIGDPILLADSLAFLGTILHLNGEYERSRSALEEGLHFAQQSHEIWFEAWAIYNLGHLDSLLGRYEQGYEQMMAGLAIWRALGDPQAIALGLNFLVTTLLQLGRFEEAKAIMEESVALCEQSKNHWGMGTAHRYWGLAYLAEGQFTEAQAHILKSLEIFGEFAVGWDIARSLTYLGDAAMLGGQTLEARKYYRDGLQSAVEAEAMPIAMDALLGLGDLQAQAGNAEQALQLSYCVHNHAASEEGTKRRAEQLIATLEPTLNSKQIEAARLIAQEKSFDMILKDALVRT
jgi:tetratricopeptide (TPR) repeat protein